MQWNPASFETCHLRMNLAGFDLPKVYKKNILCLVAVSKPLIIVISAISKFLAHDNDFPAF